MDKNVFYLSDASHDPITKKAIIAIKNMSTGQTSSDTICNIKSILAAEEYALYHAIAHAVNDGHTNCIFIYDALNIDINPIKEFYSPFFEKIQFLWCKREFLYDVDKLVRRTKKRAVRTAITQPTKNVVSEVAQKKLTDREIVALFLFLTSGKTHMILCKMIRKKYDESDVNFIVGKRYSEVALSFIYFLISKQSKRVVFKYFGEIRVRKYKTYDEMLVHTDFELWMIDDILQRRSAIN